MKRIKKHFADKESDAPKRIHRLMLYWDLENQHISGELNENVISENVYNEMEDEENKQENDIKISKRTFQRDMAFLKQFKSLRENDNSDEFNKAFGNLEFRILYLYSKLSEIFNANFDKEIEIEIYKNLYERLFTKNIDKRKHSVTKEQRLLLKDVYYLSRLSKNRFFLGVPYGEMNEGYIDFFPIEITQHEKKGFLIGTWKL